jgi:DNA helicase II / ATP-dependent DNA helicase PcrA
VSQYVMSISSLNLYLQCPLAFYYENILQLPQIYTDSARFGLLLHKALEVYFQRKNSSNANQNPGFEVLKQALLQEIGSIKHQFGSVADYQNKLEYGLRSLSGYYDEHHSTWNVPTRTEVKIDQLSIEGVPINGKIDRIDQIGDREVRLIDYKTGAFSSASAKLKKPSEESEYGGDFWRQGLFYKLIADASPRVMGTVSEVVFSYLEAESKTNKYRQVVLNPSFDDLNWMRELIKTTYAKIMEEKFEHGCGSKICTYCNLHKVANLDEERLDDIYALDE